MDPDATLKEIHDLIEAFEEDRVIPIELIKKFKALDAWLQSGGFLPDLWALTITRTPKPFGIWCDRCAKGNHNFRDPANNDAEWCLCCGSAKPEGV